MRLKAAFYTTKKWVVGSVINIKFLHPPPSNIVRTPLSTLKNSFDENGNPIPYDPIEDHIANMDIQSAIQYIVMERIQPYVGLTFNFVSSSQNADIRISFDTTSGAWSLIGTDCQLAQSASDTTPAQIQTEATMNLGWFDAATTMHEFGHALALVHEHQNPNGIAIQWNAPAVYAWALSTQGWDQATAYAQIMQPYLANLINGSTFDPESIMLYFFPGSLTLNNQGTHQNLRLSPTDVIYINQQYPTTNATSCGVTTSAPAVGNQCMSPQQFYMWAYNSPLYTITTPPTSGQNIPSQPQNTPMSTLAAQIFAQNLQNDNQGSNNNPPPPPQLPPSNDSSSSLSGGTISPTLTGNVYSPQPTTSPYKEVIYSSIAFAIFLVVIGIIVMIVKNMGKKAAVSVAQSKINL